MNRNSKVNLVNSKKKIIVPALLDWFSQCARDLPWRCTRDPYAIWVSEIMLQQTQVKTVMPFWELWMAELPTIQSLANASSGRIHKLWEGLGYYTRVRNMQKAAQQILEKHDGKFPERFDDVLALPGIGRYTAGAICSIAFNQPMPILDGNVIRVLTRIYGIAANPREKKINARLWQIAETLVHQSSLITHHSSLRCSHLNQSLMELGALICTPRTPQCQICPARKICVARRENSVHELPNLGTRPKQTTRRFAAFVVERNGAFLVRQRPAGVVNAHLWEFPNVELNGESHLPAVAKSALGFIPKKLHALCEIKHSITRYRITLEAHRAGAPITRSGIRASNTPKKDSSLHGRWLTVLELKKLSFPSAHKKILAALADAL